jgi:aminoglycoside phosphotransferase (APT) family kinase protein
VRFPFPVTPTVGFGRPAAGTRCDRTDATRNDPRSSEVFARDLALLIAGLRAAETRGRTFTGASRGGDLQDHDKWVEECLRRSGQLLDAIRRAALWQHFRRLPRTEPDVMSHGDLIPANLLVAKGRLTGVLDCGGFGPGDPALDVIAGWHLLDDGPQVVLRAELASDDLE